MAETKPSAPPPPPPASFPWRALIGDMRTVLAALVAYLAVDSVLMGPMRREEARELFVPKNELSLRFDQLDRRLETIEAELRAIREKVK